MRSCRPGVDPAAELANTANASPLAPAGELAGTSPARRWPQALRALRHRNFRIFIAGQAVSLLGTWMQNLGQSWLVYRLTGSELAVGFTGFCANGGVLFLGPLAGLVADRKSRYHIVLATQIAFLLQAFVLAWLTMTGRVSATQVFLLAAAWGVINAFDVPARQSLYIHMVGKQDLINAISLNAVVFNAARLLGPAVAGFVIAAWGEGVCFLINAVTFVAVIGSLLWLRLPALPRASGSSPVESLKEGLRYVHRQLPVRALLGINAAVNLSRAPLLALAPFFADAIFHRGSQGLGVLTGISGLGAVAGTLGLAQRTSPRGLSRVVFWSAATTGLCLALAAGSPSFWLLLVVFALLGYSQMRQNASVNTLVQNLIPDEFRGRVMALYSMTVVGVLPVGHLVGGAVAEQIGPRWTVFWSGLACLLATIWFRRCTGSIERSLAAGGER